MRMTITLDNVTTDKALRLLSALEFGNLIKDTKVEMDPDDAVAVASEYLHRIQAEKPSQIETAESHETTMDVVRQVEEIVREVSRPKDAADCDLFIDDVAGFHLQDALDAWVQGRDTAPKHLMRELPLIGSVTRSNLVSIANAQAMLGWGASTIYTFIHTGTAACYMPRNAWRYYLTREQVAILALAAKIQEATGKKKLHRSVMRQATRAFLTTFPEYTRQMSQVA